MDSHVDFSVARSNARVAARSLKIKTDDAYRAAVAHRDVIEAKLRLGQASAADVRNAIAEVQRWEALRTQADRIESAVYV